MVSVRLVGSTFSEFDIEIGTEKRWRSVDGFAAAKYLSEIKRAENKSDRRGLHQSFLRIDTMNTFGNFPFTASQEDRMGRIGWAK